MPIDEIEFVKLEEEITKKGKSFPQCLPIDIGKVYVISITRDGCPACKSQKPKMEKLAKNVAEKHRDKVVFTRIHVNYTATDDKESMRSKSALGHYFYPTNIILLGTRDMGAIEYYRNVSTPMNELKRNIETALETAETMKKK